MNAFKSLEILFFCQTGYWKVQYLININLGTLMETFRLLYGFLIPRFP